jgi:hypothetical protein
MREFFKAFSIGLFVGVFFAYFFDEFLAAMYRAYYRRALRHDRMAPIVRIHVSASTEEFRRGMEKASEELERVKGRPH